MGVDLFRLGVAVILLALMFLLVPATDRYVGTETSIVTFFLWLIGVIIVFVSAFTSGGRRSGCAESGQ